MHELIRDSLRWLKTHQITEFVVCWGSSARRQQLNIPNDAASYDPIRLQSGSWSLCATADWPCWLKHPTAEGLHAHSDYSQYCTPFVTYCSAVCPSEEETQRVKSAAVSLNFASPDLHGPCLRICTWLCQALAVTETQITPCMCDGFVLIIVLDPKGGAA